MSASKKGVLLLISRVIIGGIFIAAGWMKVSDMAATVGYFHQMGIPAFLAYAVGYIELIGGVLVVIGFWECASTAVLAVIMVFAVYFSYPLGLQAYMAPLGLLGGLLALIPSGAGKFSVSAARGKGMEQ